MIVAKFSIRFTLRNVVRVKSPGEREPTIYINHPPKADDEKARQRRFRARVIAIWWLVATPVAAVLHIWTWDRVAILVPIAVAVALFVRDRISPQRR
jgi:hypothetical protein